MIGWRKSSKCEANTCVEVYLGHRQVRVRSTAIVLVIGIAFSVAIAGAVSDVEPVPSIGPTRDTGIFGDPE